MINMPKDGYNRGAHDKGSFILTGDGLPPERDFAGFLLRDSFGISLAWLKPHFVRQDRSGIVVDRLVNASHYPIGHQLLDDLNRTDIDYLCKRPNGNNCGEFYFFSSGIAHSASPSRKLHCDKTGW